MGVCKWLPDCLRICFLLLSLGCILGQQEFDTTCRSEPVPVGEMGMMNISFRPQIDLGKENVFIYLKKEHESVDTLRCARQKPELPLQCETVKGSGFLTEGLVDHELRLVVPNTTMDRSGVYVLLVYINDVPDPPIDCVFTVLRETETEKHLAASEESGSNPVSIVVPILVVLAGIAIATGLLIYFHRRRKKKREPNKADEEEPMNTRDIVDSTEAVDKGDFAIITTNSTRGTTGDVNTAISTDATTTTTAIATTNPITTSSSVDTNTTPTTSTDPTNTATTTTSSNTNTNAPTAASTTNTTTSSATTTASSDIDTNAPTTATTEASNTTPTITDSQPARATKDIDEGKTPVKVNPLLKSRAPGRTNRPSARARLPQEDTTTDRNTRIGIELRQNLRKGPMDFKERGKRHGSAELEENDVFYTAKMT